MIPCKSIHSEFLIFIVICLTVDIGYCEKSKSNTDHAAFPSQDLNSEPSSTVTTSYVADQMCREYSRLIYSSMKNPVLNTTNRVKDCVDTKALIVGGTRAKPKEFPHMALLGIDQKSIHWVCAGSLISERWILSGAIAMNTISWARLGELNTLAVSNNAKYRIIEHIVHPNYKKPSQYNDIALYRLEKDVIFSSYIRPICLNTDKSLNPSVAIATGWGRTSYVGGTSDDLLKVKLDIIPINKCNVTYSLIENMLDHGIDEDSMICAGSEKGGKDTCAGDSGGPLQIENSNYECMYTQIGIVSFGKSCGMENSPGVYTKVSKYIPWIESIVWPKLE